MGYIEINSKIWTIVLHKSPDADAITGAWLLERFGEKKFPGISNAKHLFWSGGEEFRSGGNFISVDIGGGPYDHHHSTSKVSEECAATLVAKDLGLNEEPALTEILKYIKEHDLRGIRTPLDFADCVRCLNQAHREDPERILEMGFEILDALYTYFADGETVIQEDRNRLATIIENWLKGKDQRVSQQIQKFGKGLRNGNKRSLDLTTIFCALEIHSPKALSVIEELLEVKYLTQIEFFRSADEELKKAKITSIFRGSKELRVVTIQSDNPSFAALARNREHGRNAAIVIQKNEGGRTLIFTNNRFFLKEDIKQIAAAIRFEEQVIMNRGKKEELIIDFNILSQPGHLLLVPNWYFQKEENRGGGKLLNGSFTSPDIPATRISLERIREIVEKVLALGRNFKWEIWCHKEYKIPQSHHKTSTRRRVRHQKAKGKKHK